MIEIMKTQTARNTALALVGLLALSVYILACTSFSPDDTKVLYPVFHRASGALGMAVYDRQARRSDLVFLPLELEGGADGAAAANYLRGEWLPDGRSLLIAWTAAKDNEDSLDLALIPSGTRAPFRLFHLSGIKEPGTTFLAPFCVAGGRVFISAGPQEVARLDLLAGAVVRHPFKDAGKEIRLFPAADGGAFYVESPEPPATGLTFGRLDPESFSRSPLLRLTNEVGDGAVFAYDRDGKGLALLEKSNETNQLVVLRQGHPPFTRALDAKNETLGFGNAGFSFEGDVVWATFRRVSAGKSEAAYGLMEIPLNGAPVRETLLIAAAPAGNDSDAAFFQGCLSHDGKTVAVDSTYLACLENPIAASDCALFLVDLSEPHREVTKVPIPVPAKHSQLK
jgi:hypothetical protein